MSAVASEIKACRVFGEGAEVGGDYSRTTRAVNARRGWWRVVGRVERPQSIDRFNENKDMDGERVQLANKALNLTRGGAGRIEFVVESRAVCARRLRAG